MRPITVPKEKKHGGERSQKRGPSSQGKKPFLFSLESFSSFSFLNRNLRGRKRELITLKNLKNRFLLASGGISVLALTILWIQGYPHQLYDMVGDQILDFSRSIGFQVRDIVVTGRVRASSNQILQQIGLSTNDPIFKFSPQEICDRLHGIPWIKEVQVQRRLPDTLYIRIQERKPLALWQNHQKHVLVDEEGVVIPEENLGNYKNLPIVVGAQAPIYVRDILSTLIKKPQIQSRVTALVWVSGRRWNLQLDGTIEVKLPETPTSDQIDASLDRLTKVLAQPKINFKDVKSIDLRLPHQISLKLSGAAEQHIISNLDKSVDA